MEYTKGDINWLMVKAEKCSKRYMEAEHFVISLMELNWWKRVLFAPKIVFGFYQKQK